MIRFTPRWLFLRLFFILKLFYFLVLWICMLRPASSSCGQRFLKFMGLAISGTFFQVGPHGLAFGGDWPFLFFLPQGEVFQGFSIFGSGSPLVGWVPRCFGASGFCPGPLFLVLGWIILLFTQRSSFFSLVYFFPPPLFGVRGV